MKDISKHVLKLSHYLNLGDSRLHTGALDQSQVGDKECITQWIILEDKRLGSSMEKVIVLLTQFMMA